jgi:citrate lyase gamma subunit
MKIRKNGLGISIFNCYRHLRVAARLEEAIELELDSELGAQFIQEISELTQEQIDEMVKMAEEEEDDDDSIPF